MFFDQWLLDVSLADTGSFSFVPLEDDRVVLGMTLIQDHSPGELVGVVSMNGQEDVERWLKQNPEWKTTYGPISEQSAIGSQP